MWGQGKAEAVWSELAKSCTLRSAHLALHALC